MRCLGSHSHCESFALILREVSVAKVLHLIMVDQVDLSPYQGHEILQESEQYSF